MNSAFYKGAHLSLKTSFSFKGSWVKIIIFWLKQQTHLAPMNQWNHLRQRGEPH
jgi:hypothetical protein